MAFIFEEFFSFSDEVLYLIESLEVSLFDKPHSFDVLKKKVEGKDNCCALFFKSNGCVVSFKVGYQVDDYFYSWLGGTLPEFRGQGLASRLILRQHQWADQQGFKKVRTHSYSKFSEMLKLNEKHGFKIVDPNTPKKSNLEKIVLEKLL